MSKKVCKWNVFQDISKFTLGGVRLYFPHYSHFQIFNVNKGLKRFFIYMLLMCDTGVSHMSSFQSIAGQNINII